MPKSSRPNWPRLLAALAVISFCGWFWWVVIGAVAGAWPRGDYHQQPPKQYRGEFTALVHFWTPEHVRAACNAIAGAAPAGKLYEGCQLNGEIWAPMPWDWAPGDAYQLLMGHEGGHVDQPLAGKRGWPGDHPDK